MHVWLLSGAARGHVADAAQGSHGGVQVKCLVHTRRYGCGGRCRIIILPLKWYSNNVSMNNRILPLLFYKIFIIFWRPLLLLSLLLTLLIFFPINLITIFTINIM